MELDLLGKAIGSLVAEARRIERADTLAFLRRRQAMAVKVGSRNPEEAERAGIIVQQIGIEIEAIEQFLHIGDAAVEAALVAEALEADWAAGSEELAETNTFNQEVSA